MKRKISTLLIVLLLLPLLTFSVSGRQNAFVIDNAGILSNSQEDTLQQTISGLRETYDMDVVILTESSLGGQRPQDYADDYYDGHDFAPDGLLFLLALEERDWYISTKGSAIYALTDYGIQLCGNAATPYLSSGDYFEAFQAFLGELPFFLDAYQEGKPVDGYADYSGSYYHGDQEEVLHYEEPYKPSFLLSLGIGLVTALICVGIMRGMMNTKRPKASAAEYMDRGSYRLVENQDIFLYSQVTKRAKPKDPPSSGGGGSSVHTSSSGSSHGGGGGKF